jgi:BirA family biotin operon repressor/biotin-[acetyl-CoA-carboxylase] ligase
MTSLRYYFLPTVDSTNAEAKRLLQAGQLTVPTVVWATHQTLGRGTKGRPWKSPPRSGLTFTLVYPKGTIPKFCVEAQPGELTQAAGQVLAQHLNRTFALPVVVKPINDLYLPLADKPDELGKLAGILTETMIQGSEWQGLLMGVGINWWETPGAPASYPVTSVCDYNPDLASETAEGLIPPMAEKLALLCQFGYTETTPA